MSQLDTDCLKINANWAPIEVITVRQAFSDAAAGAVTLLKFSEGYPVPFRLQDWLKLEVEDGEDYVTTSRLHELKKILVPRVCITTKFNRIIAKEQRCTLQNLARRYKGRCAVTGRKLAPHEFSREHVVPRAKGGHNGWDNEVLMDRQLNSKRGHKDYSEVGLQKPAIAPEPRPLLPINTIVNRHGFPEWDLFQIPRPNARET